MISSITRHTCPNTGKKTLYIVISYNNYNNLVTRINNDHDFLTKIINLFDSYQIKYKIEKNHIEYITEDTTEDISEDISELLNNLSI